jgi:hypothetical protein
MRRTGSSIDDGHASGTDWVKAGVTHATVQYLLVRNLVERG